MTIHPLRRAYNKYIRENYGVYVSGDNKPQRTEIIAQSVVALGVSYEVYVEIACSLLHRWAQAKSWKYPYWNAVTSDGTIERVADLLQYVDVLSDDGFTAEFQRELAFAFDYIYWLIGYDGCTPVMPKRSKPVSASAQVQVAEYICTAHGVSCVTSDYCYISKQIEDHDAR